MYSVLFAGLSLPLTSPLLCNCTLFITFSPSSLASKRFSLSLHFYCSLLPSLTSKHRFQTASSTGRTPQCRAVLSLLVPTRLTGALPRPLPRLPTCLPSWRTRRLLAARHARPVFARLRRLRGGDGSGGGGVGWQRGGGDGGRQQRPGPHLRVRGVQPRSCPRPAGALHGGATDAAGQPAAAGAAAAFETFQVSFDGCVGRIECTGYVPFAARDRMCLSLCIVFSAGGVEGSERNLAVESTFRCDWTRGRCVRRSCKRSRRATTS